MAITRTQSQPDSEKGKELKDYLISLQVQDSSSVKALGETQEAHMERGGLLLYSPQETCILFGASDLGLATLSNTGQNVFVFNE